MPKAGHAKRSLLGTFTAQPKLLLRLNRKVPYKDRAASPSADGPKFKALLRDIATWPQIYQETSQPS
jgi:hypothetical protein